MKKTQQSWIFPQLYIGILQNPHVEDYIGVLYYFAHIMLDFFSENCRKCVHRALDYLETCLQSGN